MPFTLPSPARRAVVFAALALASAAHAQLPALPQFNFSRLEVDSGGSGSLVVGTGDILPTGTARLSIAGDYEKEPLLLIQDGQVVGPVISDRYTVHVVGGWAPFQWLQLGLDVPIIAAQEGVDLREYGIPLPTPRALGSPTGSVRLRFTSQAHGAPIDTALQVGVRPPLGTNGAWVADERWGIAPRVMVGRNLFSWLLLGAEAGVRWLPGQRREAVEDEEGGAEAVDATNQVQLGAVASAGAADGLRAEVSARTAVSFTGRRGAVELLGGLRWNLGWVELFALAGPSLGDVPGTPRYRVLAGMAIAPPLTIAPATPGS